MEMMAIHEMDATAIKTGLVIPKISLLGVVVAFFGGGVSGSVGVLENAWICSSFFSDTESPTFGDAADDVLGVDDDPDDADDDDDVLEVDDAPEVPTVLARLEGARGLLGCCDFLFGFSFGFSFGVPFSGAPRPTTSL